jgi:hypothetical protein
MKYVWRLYSVNGAFVGVSLFCDGGTAGRHRAGEQAPGLGRFAEQRIIWSFNLPALAGMISSLLSGSPVAREQ